MLAVKRKEGLVAEISAIQHEPGKFDNVDFGTRLDPKPITVVPPSVQAAPQNIRLASRSVIDQGIARHVAEISWAAAPSAVAYHVQWRRDNSDWVEAGRTGSLTLELPDIRAGAYVARVRAINVADVSSVWASSTETQLQGDLAPPPALAQLATQSQVFGIGLRWAFRKDASPRSAPRSGTARPTTAPARSSWGFRLSAERAHPVRPVGRQALFLGRIVALNGEIGAWYPDGPGVMGEASWQASEILEYLNGQIKRDQLAQELTSTIDGLTTGLIRRAPRSPPRRRSGSTPTARWPRGWTPRWRWPTAPPPACRNRARRWRAGWPAQGHLERQGPGHQGRQGLCGRHVAGAYTNPDGRVQSSVYFLADRFGFLSLANGPSRRRS